MATDWLQLAKDSYDASTTYIDSYYRRQWEANIRAFQSKHPVGSKYLSDSFKYRSKGFRPKTRSVIRKNEAAAAAALFSNMDVTNVDPVNPDDPMNVASAFVGKELLQYRLTKTIPWFKLCMGAFQDAQTVGIVCSYQYWKYQAKKTSKKTDDLIESGEPYYEDETNIIEDRPCIELRPIENIRIDAAADWLDPINSSPFLIDIIPMYAVDVKKMMNTKNGKTGEPIWKKLTDEELRKGVNVDEGYDRTRMEREPLRQDRFKEDQPLPLGDFEVVWVHRNFMRMGDSEKVYYTLGTHFLLSTPKDIKDVYPYLDGERPYVMGVCIVESHRPMPSGVADLAAPLQAEANEIANQRRDNVKLVLDKRWFAARGKQVDIESLVRNVPGGVTLMNDVNMDVKEVSWSDVTSSAFMEQDRINVDLDDLVGNFANSSVQTNRQLNETVGGMKMLNSSASMMTEYLLRTFIETWAEPVLRQLMKLEQYYESDEVVLALAAQKARLWTKFGISQVSDDLLKKDLNLVINVGMGATNPDDRLKKFMQAVAMSNQVSQQSAPGANVKEIVKEIFSFSGFRDGTRFFPDQIDPQLAQAMKMIQQLQGQVQSKQMELQSQAQITQMTNQSNEKIKAAQLQVDAHRIQGDLAIRQAELQKPSDSTQHQIAIAETGAKIEHMDKELEFNKWKAQLEADAKVVVAEITAKTQLKTASINANSAAQASSESASIVNESGDIAAGPTLGEVLNTVNKNMEQITLNQSALGDLVKAHGEAQKEIVASLSKPKSHKIVRDNTGKIAQVVSG